MKQIGKENKKILFGILVLGIMAVLLIIRAHYGMDATDETLYLSIAKRFSEGDLLFRDEWNTCQLFGLLLVPFYKGYVLIHGNNEGIMLVARECFVVFSLAVILFIFLQLSKITGKIVESLVISICLLLYVRGNIINFSYYSVAQYCFLLSIFLWIKGEQNIIHNRLMFVFSGISYAVAVVSMPYLAVLFFVVLLIGCIMFGKHDERRNKYILFIIGVCISAIVFLLMFRKWIPWKNLFEYLPFMFQDPTMEHEGIFGQLIDILKYIVGNFLKYTWWLYLLTIAACILIRKTGKENGKLLTEVQIVLAVEFFLQAIYVRTYFEGGILLTLFLLAVQLYLLEKKTVHEDWVKYFVIPGIAFSILWILGSNVGERVMNMGILIADVWAIDVIWNTKTQKKYIKTCLKTTICWLALILGIIRFLDIYRDGKIQGLEIKVAKGAYEGVYTEKNRAQAYEKTVDLLQEYTDDEDRIAVLGRNPWVYLDTDAKCATYTAWNIRGTDLVIENYYTLFPEKIPNVLITVDPEIQTYENWKFSSHGSGIQKGEEIYLDGIYEQIVSDGIWKKKQAGGSILYRRVE